MFSKGLKLIRFAGFYLLATSFLVAAPPPTAQDQFLQIYFLLMEAENLEKAGQKTNAITRYQEVQKRLESLKKNNPDWQPVIVNFRLKYVKDKLAGLNASDKQLPTIPKPEATPTKPNPLGPGPAQNPTPLPLPVTPSTGIQPPVAPTMPQVQPIAETPVAPPTPPSVTPDETIVLKARIVVLEKELQDYKGKYLEALEETNKLRQRLESTERELTAARSGTVDSRVAKLLQENNSLKDQLNHAEAQVKQLRQGGSTSDVSVPLLQTQLKKVQDQLALLEQENQAYKQTTAELKAQLSVANQQVSDSASGKMDENIRKENEVLRNIINRQLQEQARRDAAKRLAMEELQHLKIKSEVLRQQIELLGSPLSVLSSEELALLHTPNSIDILAPDNGFKAPLESPVPEQMNSAPSAHSSEPSHETGSGDYRNKPRVPDDMRSLAQEAGDLFNKKRYAEAADKYRSITEKYPESLYAWSNLGVVKFQMQDLTGAEEALRQAIKLSPNDAFSHSVLGIVYYQLNRFDDAVQILTKATTLDANDAKTHNYLGIACSQKGWQEAAEQECRKAIEIDPNYGDAHFNLAVIYATQKPPAKELARKHYKRALDLGIPKDPQIEKLINP